jgi:hypothetical protein
MKRASILSLLSFVLLPACFSFQERIELQGHPLPLPTTNEIALVNGKPFTISSLISIRSTLRNASNETAFWVGVGGLLLQQQALSDGKILAVDTAIEVARYAIGDINPLQATPTLKDFFRDVNKTPDFPQPEEVKRQVDLLIKQATILKNNQLISLAY